MSLKKWKKIELLDLADKLDVHVAHSSTKAKIADAIDAHLSALETPLDLQEFPELAAYYEAASASESGDDVERGELGAVTRAGAAGDSEGGSDVTVDGDGDGDVTADGGDDDEDVSDADADADAKPAWFSKLDFATVAPASSGFAFKFHEFLHDVRARAREANEAVQDALSTIPAVDALFMAVELYVYVVAPRVAVARTAPYVAVAAGWRELLALLAFWSAWSLAVPAFVAYYVNFIRYDLPDVAVDPMVFHVTKALLALLLTQWQPSFADEASYTVKEVAGTASALDAVAHWFRFALVEWRLQLGLTPFVMATAGAALCLYVL
ncbi:LAFE_0F11584g1_1 [Lachancea fermentati]|uniref:LAFE_0F11584g1_1 n=1 Tax=Lachancea fermentati TaxID=4955 RepID=A0A1G4MFU4_LACFM|nr:LAFE_0F11584g1_1 [Lachancea fermentati]